MGRMYSATFEEVAVTVVQDLFEILVSSTTSLIIIHSISISQSSDAGDTESEMLNLLAWEGSTFYTTGSGGTSITAAPLQVGSPAFSGSIEANNTTQASRTFIQKVLSDGFNVLHGYYRQFAPNERIVIPTGNHGFDWFFALSLETAPTDSLTMSGTIVFEEI